MTPTLAIAAREFLACFRTAAGPVVIALFAALAGAFVALAVITPGAPAELRGFFAVSQWLALIIAPAISMRLIADELRANTIEPLRASPISEWHIALGKLLGSFAFYNAVLLPTLAFPILLAALTDIEPAPIITGYLGLLLLGLTYLSVGLFASSLTDSQVVAFLLTFAFFIALWVATGPGAQLLGPPLDQPLFALSIQHRLAPFAAGVIDLTAALFFLTFASIALLLTVISLQWRHWR